MNKMNKIYFFSPALIIPVILVLYINKTSDFKEENFCDSTYYLPNIYWDFNSHKLNPVSYIYLDSLINLLNRDKKMEIYFEVYEHRNPESSASYLKLRAKSLKDYMVANGIDETRVTSEGISVVNIDDYNYNVKGMAKEEIIERHNIFKPIVLFKTIKFR